MNILKRAFLYVTRKISKSILLFAILLTMATFVLTGLSIQSASETAQLHLRKSLGGSFDIFVDWENSPYIVKENVSETVDAETGKASMSYLMYSTKQLTPKHIAAIKEIPGVKACSARFDSLVPFDNLSLFPGTILVDEKQTGKTTAYGVCSSEDDGLFTSGTLVLSEGSHITPDDRCTAVISKDLAERNDLHIGDFITAHSYDTETDMHTGKEIQLRVIGLFTPNALEQFGETVTAYEKIQNRIFTDLQSALDMDGGDQNYGFSAMHVTIDDPQNMEQIISDVKALPAIDWDAFMVDSDNEAYENAAAPLTALGELVAALLAVIIVVSAVILALILTLSTKTRIHEIGIFLSVGIRKSAIVGQHLLEVLLLAVFAFGLSYFTSNAVAEGVGNHLLEQSMQTASEDEEVISAAAAVDAGSDSFTQKPLPEENHIQVKVDPKHLVLLYLIGFAVITTAVSASSVTVMRLKPREILSKMS